MEKTKIKRGNSYILFDDLVNSIVADWNSYIDPNRYNYGKNVDFNEMARWRTYLLEGLKNGNIVYNPIEGNFTDNSGMDLNIDDNLKYAAGLVAKKIVEASAYEDTEKKSDWTSQTFFNDAFKNGVFGGQEPDLDMLKRLDEINPKTNKRGYDNRKQVYLDFLNYALSKIEDVPENKREQIRTGIGRALGYYNDGKLNELEKKNLYILTGNKDWSWLTNEEVDKKADPTTQNNQKVEQKTLSNKENILYTLEKISSYNNEEIKKYLENISEEELDKRFDQIMKSKSKRIKLNNGKDYSKSEILNAIGQLLKRPGKGYKREGNKIIQDSNYAVHDKV